MADQSAPRAGVIEGSGRVLRELIRTPRIRQTIRIVLRELDPENVPALLKSIREEDPELFLSLLSSTPSFANIGIEGAKDLLAYMAALQPDMLYSFVAELAKDINAERLGETAALSFALLLKAAKDKDDGLIDALEGMKKGFKRGFEKTLKAEKIEIDKEKWAEQFVALGLQGAGKLASNIGKESVKKDSKTKKLVDQLAEGMQSIANDNPDFMENVVHPLLEAGIESLSVNDSDNGDE